MTHPYITELYAKSLNHWAEPLFIPAWNNWVMVKPIESDLYDACSPHPISILTPDTDIEAGLSFLKDKGLVSLILVLDDFHRPDLTSLGNYFDVVRPFKTHYIYNPSKGPILYDKHHRYELRQARKDLRTAPLDLKVHLSEWMGLYKQLVTHHQLSGLHDFQEAHHKALSNLDGIVAFGAWAGDELVSCHIWAYEQGYAHSHLAASNATGYKTRAAYAVNDEAINFFKDAKLLNFGGGAGYSQNDADGLSKFKKGFSNQTASAYICGAVLNQDRYTDLINRRSLTEKTDFFPAYRAIQTGDSE